MSKSGGNKTAQPENRAPSDDSPKPHGDKLASARGEPSSEGQGAEGGGNPASAQSSGDSPKPHGDKLRVGQLPNGKGGSSEGRKG
jgi:hypothetical protein